MESIWRRLSSSEADSLKINVAQFSGIGSTLRVTREVFTLSFVGSKYPKDGLPGVVESFNGRLRDECLNANLFFSIDDARRRLEA